jgi:hypothetical protein
MWVLAIKVGVARNPEGILFSWLLLVMAKVRADIGGKLDRYLVACLFNVKLVSELLDAFHSHTFSQESVCTAGFVGKLQIVKPLHLKYWKYDGCLFVLWHGHILCVSIFGMKSLCLTV